MAALPYAAVYEAHRACSRRLRGAYELGCALADALDRKTPRPARGRARIQEDEDVARFREVLEGMLDRGRTFRTGGSRLRVALDDLVNACVDFWKEAVLESRSADHQSVLSLYFGWRFGARATLSPGPGLSVGDAAQLRAFADRLEDALDCAEGAGVAGTGTWCRGGLEASERVAATVRTYRMAIRVFRVAYRELCARAIQRAWRRARDTPGYAVWRRRMLAEFEELSGLVQ